MGMCAGEWQSSPSSPGFLSSRHLQQQRSPPAVKPCHTTRRYLPCLSGDSGLLPLTNIPVCDLCPGWQAWLVAGFIPGVPLLQAPSEWL